MTWLNYIKSGYITSTCSTPWPWQLTSSLHWRMCLQCTTGHIAPGDFLILVGYIENNVLTYLPLTWRKMGHVIIVMLKRGYCTCDYARAERQYYLLCVRLTRLSNANHVPDHLAIRRPFVGGVKYTGWVLQFAYFILLIAVVKPCIKVSK